MYMLELLLTFVNVYIVDKSTTGRSLTPQGLQFMSTNMVSTVTGALGSMMVLAFTSMVIGMSVSMYNREKVPGGTK